MCLKVFHQAGELLYDKKAAEPGSEIRSFQMPGSLVRDKYSVQTGLKRGIHVGFGRVSDHPGA